jgi:hypothetical protein
MLSAAMGSFPAIEESFIITRMWKEAQQEVRQHWFIDSYIAAYIQIQYRVGDVHPTGLTVARGVRRCPQGRRFR